MLDDHTLKKIGTPTDIKRSIEALRKGFGKEPNLQLNIEIAKEIKMINRNILYASTGLIVLTTLIPLFESILMILMPITIGILIASSTFFLINQKKEIRLKKIESNIIASAKAEFIVKSIANKELYENKYIEYTLSICDHYLNEVIAYFGTDVLLFDLGEPVYKKMKMDKSIETLTSQSIKSWNVLIKKESNYYMLLTDHRKNQKPYAVLQYNIDEKSLKKIETKEGKITMNENKLNRLYQYVRTFHKTFLHPINNKPTVMDAKTALNRSIFTAEELVEFLHASSENKEEFDLLIAGFNQGIKNAVLKSSKEAFPQNDLDRIVAQNDALVDSLYFNMGSFAITGVNPEPLFEIVQEANMSKLDKNGKPIFRKEDNKIMKPDGWEAPEPKLKKEIENQLHEPFTEVNKHN